MNNEESDFRSNVITSAKELLKDDPYTLLSVAVTVILHGIDPKLVIEITNDKFPDSTEEIINKLIHEFYVKWMMKNKILNTMS